MRSRFLKLIAPAVFMGIFASFPVFTPFSAIAPFPAFALPPSQQLVERADQAINAKNYSSALSLADQALKLEPKLSYAHFVKGRAYGLQGQLDKGIAEFTQTLKMEPKYYPANAERASLLFKKKRYRDAIADFTMAIRLGPNAEIYAARANALVELGQFRSAIPDATKAIELNPKNWHAYRLRGICYLNVGPYDKAAEDWKKAIELNPTDVALYCGAAETFQKSTSHDETVILITSAFNRGVKSKQLYKFRADAYYKQEMYKEAAADLSVIINTYKPIERFELWDHYKLRGRCYLRAKEYAKAEQDCTEALKIAPDDSKSFACRADARERLGKFKEAIDDLTHTIKLDPNDGRAFSNRAKLYQHLGDTKRAEADRKEALRLSDKQWGI